MSVTPTINVESLPPPSSWAERITYPIAQSRRTPTGMIRTTDLDNQKEQTIILLVWQNVRREVADAIWRHYEAFNAGAWSWGAPARTVRWFSPPTFSWTSPIAANVNGELEVTLAHD